MAIDSTPSFSEISAEFGQGNKFTSYLGQGGAPSSLPLKFTDFIGLSAVIISLPEDNPFEVEGIIRSVTSGSGFGTARLIVRSDGVLQRRHNTAGDDALTNIIDIGLFWHKDKPLVGVGSGFEVKFDIVIAGVGTGSDGASAATGVWLALSSDRFFEQVTDTVTTSSGLIERQATITVSIRDVGQTMLVSENFHLLAKAEGVA